MEIASHLLHVVAYTLLTAVLIRVAYRSLLVRQLKRLPVHPTLEESRDRVVEMLDLAVIKITPFEAFAFVGAHGLLAIGSILDLLALSPR